MKEVFNIITELQAKAAKPRDKAYMIRDDRGLYLRVDPGGRKYWILRYWENKREHQISLGPYPLVGLKDARIKRDEIQIERLKGVSPRKQRERVKRSFASVTQEWLKVRIKDKSPRYVRVTQNRLSKHILPAFGDWFIEDIRAQDILRLCREIEAKGHYSTAHRVKSLMGQVFRFAVASGLAEHDPTASLTGALQNVPQKHFATLTDPDEIRALVSAIREYPAVVMRAALMFSLLTFARPGEVRQAEWSEIKGDVWDIPAEKMKMRRRHVVPLSKQAQELLAELRTYTGEGRYLFPSPRGKGPVHQNTVRLALHNLGYKENMTLHGFRGMASTILHEQGFNPLIIERQLAHVQADTVARAYNHAEYLEERRAMMQHWADWLFGSEE